MKGDTFALQSIHLSVQSKLWIDRHTINCPECLKIYIKFMFMYSIRQFSAVYLFIYYLLCVPEKCKAFFSINQKLHCDTCVLWVYSLLLKSVFQKLWFCLLKCHHRCRLCLTSPVDSQRTQTRKARGRESRENQHFSPVTWLWRLSWVL